jgi:5'-methylthioadenosine phosphorylase
MEARIAVIGGSGLDQVPGLEVIRQIEVSTPFGPPSDRINVWNVGATTDTRVAFLPRHGRGHRLLPGEVPSKANIWALKSMGVRQILAFSAVGSLTEEMAPGHFVLCDQLIDRTRDREHSFFGGGIAGHVGFADPYCASMRRALVPVIEEAGLVVHDRGTLVVMEGPQFSTRAESVLHRSWGAHLIGMTALPEAKLAREAEICLQIVAMVTDYDCWHEEDEAVSAGMVERVMRENGMQARRILPSLIEALVRIEDDCVCRHAADGAIVTPPSLVPADTKRSLELLYGRYWAGSNGSA